MNARALARDPQTGMVLTRALSWNGYRGHAMSDGVHLMLRSAPYVTGEMVEQVDYLPAEGVASIVRHGERWRPMTQSERDDADHMLDRMVAAARHAVEHP